MRIVLATRREFRYSDPSGDPKLGRSMLEKLPAVLLCCISGSRAELCRHTSQNTASWTRGNLYTRRDR